MTRSEIELIDGSNYGIVRKDRISSNQIKTRPASFNSILGVWNDFRLKYYTDKLKSEKESALTQTFDVSSDKKLTDNAVEQITNKSIIIARLEEKIKILSKQSVPTNYVDNRAIKLRSKMMNNLVINCDNAYSIGVDRMEEVFGNETISNDIVSNSSEDVAITPAEIEASMDMNANVANVFTDNEVNASNDDVVNTVSDESVANDYVPSVDIVPSMETNDNSQIVSATNDSQIAEFVTNDLENVNNNSVIENGSDFSFNNSVENEVVPSSEGEDIVVDPVIPVTEVNNTDNNENNFYINSNDVKDAIDAALRVDNDENIVSTDENNDFYDNDGPALFELINPVDLDEKTYNSVNENVDKSDNVNESVEPIISKNGSSKAKIERYVNENYSDAIEESNNDTKKSSNVNPFKVITFKDIFRPSVVSYEGSGLSESENIVEGSNYNDRYVPLIVPERENSIENNLVVDNNKNTELDVANVQDMKNQYLKLQQLLRSKTARLNSVRAQRDAIKSEVEISSKSKEDATASLNEKYQLMAKYIGDLRRQCEIVDDETASNENDINNSRQIIEENRQAVTYTQKAIEELDDILNDNSSYSESDELGFSRRVA